MRALVLASTALLFAATASNAGVSTYGGSFARTCFDAAESRTTSLDALGSCDAALAVQTLTEHDRMATHVNRGIIHMLRHENELALSDYDTAIQMDARHPEAYLNKGVMAFDAGDVATAVQLAERSLALGTTKPALAYYIRAMAREQSGNVKAAYADLLKASQLAPTWGLPRQDLKRYQVVSR